ncbi:MAG: tRNA pseudouridine(38-40) synthase TruA [Acidobacteriota bacterium]
MRRIRITLSYDGTDYHGWQVQPGLATIQAAVQSVLSELEGAAVGVDASGRTDAGVHALAQVAAFSIANPIPIDNLMRVMNRRLPRDIRVSEAAEVHANFHPRFDAVAKTYEYRILRDETCSPFERDHVYHHPYPLDEQRMIAIAPLLEGEHDFTSYAAADDSDALGRSKVRTIFSSAITREGSRLIYRVRGSGFLKHMVRNIVGVLIEAGKGNVKPGDLWTPRDPGPTAPARGLYLVSVEYPPAPCIPPAPGTTPAPDSAGSDS